MRIYNEFLHREMDLPENPERIVSLAPDLTEMMFRLGFGDRLVGVSSFCWRPKGKVDHLPRVGAYLKVVWTRLQELKPDLILTTLGAQREVTWKLVEAGYPVLAFPVPMSPWGILENLRRLASGVGRVKQAEDVNAHLARTLNQHHKVLPPLKVYWEIDLGGPITAGGASYVCDTLHWLGFRNIYADQVRSYFSPDDAETRRRQPDLILYEPKRSTKPDAYWANMVRERLQIEAPVVVLPHDSLAHYGPALIDEVLPEVLKRIQQVLAQDHQSMERS